MYQVGRKGNLETAFAAQFYKTLDEAKKVGEGLFDSKRWIIIKEFGRNAFYERCSTQDGFIWILRSK